MIEVAPNLFCGNHLDYTNLVYSASHDGPKPGWAVVHAAKEPYHRQALGYTGRGAPKEHPEYLFAFRDNRLCLNLVDVVNVDYVSDRVIDAAISFIKTSLDGGQKVLVHCNQGQSRAPSIALLYLSLHDERFRGLRMAAAAEIFQRDLYPQYEPAEGMAGYLAANWPWKEAA